MTTLAAISSAHAEHAAAQADALVGREAEVADVASFVDTVTLSGGTMYLTGPAGAGKSRLLAEAVRIAEARGIRVLTTAGAEFEIDVGYASLQMLLSPIADRGGELPVAQAYALEVALGLTEGPAPRPLILGSAALGLLTRVAAPASVLLIVDDLEWVDSASSGVLQFLARRLVGTRVGLLAASRSSAQAVVFTDDVVVRHITPLDDADAGRLIATRHPALPSGVRSKIVQESRGNPLALLEFAREAALSLGQDGRHASLPVAERLRAIFTRRFEDLDRAARNALLLIALDGRRRLRDVVSLGIDADVLSAAEEAGLISVDTTTMAVTFPHPLIRAAVAQTATGSERRAAHLSIAEAIDDPDRRAWHLADAARGPDPQIAALLESVAQRSLERDDPRTAVGALVRAARLSPDQAEERRRLAEAAFRETDITGELAYASLLLADAGTVPPGSRGALHAAAAAAHVSMNSARGMDHAYRLLAQALEAHDHAWTTADDELVDALNALLLVCVWAGRAQYWETLHRAIARFAGDVPELLAIVAETSADTVGSAATVRGRLRELIREPAEQRDKGRIVRLSSAAAHLDLLGECRDSSWRVIAAGRGAGGAIRSALNAYAYLCTDDFGAGRWREQLQLADEGLALSREHGYSLFAWNFLYHRALVEAVQGDPEEAFRWATELTALTSERNAHGAERAGHHPRTLAAVAQGDWESAFRYAEGLSPAGSLIPHAPHALWVAFDLVESAMRTGRPNAARAHAAAMVATDVPSVSPRMAMMTLGARALVADPADAASLFKAAVTAQDAEAWPFDLARIRLAYGDWLRRNAETLHARAVLHDALAAFERLEATAWAERAQQSLRAAGDPASRARADLSALTAQERAIVELAAHGLSNKEIGVKLFLSARTVSGHLYRAFPKLGVTSRAALRDVLASRTSPAP
ncbi:helix-turn-helix transcriptional regulator [Microbacterium caowuchunii]|uniref:AAA family ATPase n=1 Tax=Microbacterium caowuchunii TaxID=2614638 RepID=A0A5N0TLT5_9MICO|nr:LuxR family transcriptional regulator [Microbacterium caowuchunii]KAA9136135.1 AAA family ATPase [Microbacterium caowuchunii]